MRYDNGKNNAYIPGHRHMDKGSRFMYARWASPLR